MVTESERRPVIARKEQDGNQVIDKHSQNFESIKRGRGFGSNGNEARDFHQGNHMKLKSCIALQ